MRYLTSAAWILSGIILLASGCAGFNPTPEDVERAICLAQGGTWTAPAGPCVLPTPPPVDPPPPPPVEPPPVEPPPVEPQPCPQGTPQAAGPTQNGRGFDATPRVCNPDIYPVGADGLSCGLEGRRCIPLGCEGEANSAYRQRCETHVMGGPEPEWHIRVLSGDPRLVENGWPARVIGNGAFEIWWCFPGHPSVCSKVLTTRVPE